MSEISEDDLIVFKVLADRASVTEPGYVIPKLAEAVHKLLAEVERLKGQRDDVLYRMARYRADTMLGQQIRDIYNDVVYCAHEWPAQDTRLPEHKCALPTSHDGDHLCWCGVASLAEATAAGA